MIYLFTSGSTPRYRADALEVLCYPDGHVMRFRYLVKYIAPSVSKLEACGDGTLKLPDSARTGCVVYADDDDSWERGIFRFFPLRTVEVLQITRRGSAVYVDFALGAFANYGNVDAVKSLQEQQQRQERELQRLFCYPLPGSRENQLRLPEFSWNRELKRVAFDDKDSDQHQGWFMNDDGHVVEEPATFSVPAQDDAWESTVKVLASMSTLANSLFIRVTGFVRPEGWVRGERLVRAKRIGVDARYVLRAGQYAVLKVLFYQPNAKTVTTRIVKVNDLSDAFAGISPTEIKVDSRYNEQRVIVGCKRTLESIIAPLSLTCDNDSDSLMPEPLFLVEVSPPWVAMTIALILLTLAAVLVSLGPDTFASLGVAESLRGVLTGWSKAFAALFTLIAGFIAFRRLPVGK